MSTLQHGLRPVIDDEDEQAIAALSPEERAALDAYTRQWDRMALVEGLRETCRICLPIALLSVAIIVAVWGNF
jgi:hypothetical protein